MRTKVDLAVPDIDSYSPDTLARIGKNLDVDFVVVGSYLASGARDARLRVDVHIQNTATGETVRTEMDTGTEEELFALVSRLGARLRARFGGRRSVA